MCGRKPFPAALNLHHDAAAVKTHDARRIHFKPSLHHVQRELEAHWVPVGILWHATCRKHCDCSPARA